MSCELCDTRNEPIERTDVSRGCYTYIRVGTGNVLVSGCDDHLRELIERSRWGRLRKVAAMMDLVELVRECVEVMPKGTPDSLGGRLAAAVEGIDAL